MVLESRYSYCPFAVVPLNCFGMATSAGGCTSRNPTVVNWRDVSVRKQMRH